MYYFVVAGHGEGLERTKPGRCEDDFENSSEPVSGPTLNTLAKHPKTRVSLEVYRSGTKWIEVEVGTEVFRSGTDWEHF